MLIDRYGIQVGSFKIYFYGIIIMLGVLMATWLASRLAKKHGEDPQILWDMLPWVLVGGIIGARLWHILTPPPSMVAQGVTTYYYFTHPLEAINLRNGGLGILGAVLGGALAMFIFVRRHELSFFRWVDFIAPGLALAQAMGRWGNFLNQELYGAPTTLPWGIYIDPAHRHPGFEQYSYYHPTFLYESVLNLMNMGLMLWVGNRFRDKLKDGDIFLIYAIVYPLIRFFMEFLRLDSSTVGGININQIIMLVIAILAAAALIWRHRGIFTKQKSESEVGLSEVNEQ